jgi:hypothetical protein
MNVEMRHLLNVLDAEVSLTDISSATTGIQTAQSLGISVTMSN